MFNTLIELLYENGSSPAEAQSVMDFQSRYIEGDEMEDEFFKAIRDTRLMGFEDGVKSMLRLYSEIRRDGR
jgi:hypothetical protein